MIIYLKHPVHGTKVAILDAEAEADEQNGWERYTPGEPPAALVNVLEKRRRKTES